MFMHQCYSEGPAIHGLPQAALATSLASSHPPLNALSLSLSLFFTSLLTNNNT